MAIAIAFILATACQTSTTRLPPNGMMAFGGDWVVDVLRVSGKDEKGAGNGHGHPPML